MFQLIVIFREDANPAESIEPESLETKESVIVAQVRATSACFSCPKYDADLLNDAKFIDEMGQLLLNDQNPLGSHPQ